MIIHELRALSWPVRVMDARRPDRSAAVMSTNRLRAEATDHLLAMSEARGASNAKAKRDVGLQLRCPSWRCGFTEGLG